MLECDFSFCQSGARRGTIKTKRSVIETPAFMPVGTIGAVKTMEPRDLEALDARIILSNTFHLMLRPGLEVIGAHGGLHGFMSWNKSILTDSGGYQVFSLAKLRKLSEQGVEFHSPINGDKVFLGPEESIHIQRMLDSDIAMVFDDCTAYPATEEMAKDSMLRSLRWAQRSKLAFEGANGSLFGIVQGGMYENLRESSLIELVDIGFDGYAIGGLSVGEPKSEMQRILKFIVPKMPTDQPRYLMGVGTPEDIVYAVACGIDIFDCVLPTRNARNGWLYTSHGIIKIRNSRYAMDLSPIDADCGCPCCAKFSRAYIHHLYRINEPLCARLCTLHNLSFYFRLMQRIRDAIKNKSFIALATEYNLLG